MAVQVVGELEWSVIKSNGVLGKERWSKVNKFDTGIEMG